MKRCLKRNTSGQVLVITSLLVALLFLSTAMYVIGTEKTQSTAETGQDNVFPAYQQSLKNAVISALANVTSGGSPTALTSNLDMLTQALTSHSYQSILKIDYTPLDTAPYQNGLWISSGSNGFGVSSADVTFSFSSSGSSASSALQYSLNVTSQINLSGNTEINGNFTQVNLTVNVFNEGKPALAKNLTFYYQNGTEQTKVDTTNIIDFGNGSYTASFNIENASTPLPVSVLCEDQRGIFAGANATCTVI